MIAIELTLWTVVNNHVSKITILLHARLDSVIYYVGHKPKK